MNAKEWQVYWKDRDPRLEHSTGYKTCSQCKEVKSVNRFARNKSKKTGLFSNCQDCQNLKNKAKYALKPPRLSAFIQAEALSPLFDLNGWELSDAGWWFVFANGRKSSAQIKYCDMCGGRFLNTWHNPKKYCSKTCSAQKMGRPNPIGYTRINKNGYVEIKVGKDVPGSYKDGRMLFHRWVMQEHLNRPLKASETVHHKDLNPLNNDISNLQLRQGAHGTGASYKCLDCHSKNILTQEIADE